MTQRLRCPVRENARTHGAREALVFGGRRWTWAQVDAEVERWRHVLRSRGLGAGARVGLLSGSRPEVLFLLWAAARERVALVPYNARLTRAELDPLLEKSRPGLLVVERRLSALLPQAVELERLAEEAGQGPAVTEAGPPLELDAQAPWLLLFTSGTTGRAKAAVLGLAQLQAAARASAERLNGPELPRWLGTLPLFHVGGLAMACRVAFDGGCLVLHERFDAQAVSRALDEERITHVSFVATTLERTLEARGERPFEATLRVALIGGGPVPEALLARARTQGLACLQTYGLTEASSQATTERREEADGTTAGVPLPGVELRIVDEAGQPLPAGREGEIELRGPTLMSGYLEDAAANAAAFRDGWFRTRDLGVVDGRGRLRVLSRRTDLIVRGGENVYPIEVEAALLGHPAVAEAAVLPEPHPELGQVPVAVVVRRQPVEEGALLAFARERLARFKVPARVVWADALPRNAMNKVDRALLRALAGISSQ